MTQSQQEKPNEKITKPDESSLQDNLKGRPVEPKIRILTEGEDPKNQKLLND
ncbi:MAG: hypothetical protein HY960_10860 [Ignavibacteriae bacterium]|nr:hypothetical protein [Ignavibacteriota bacterium]